jgi:hypothetical protein
MYGISTALASCQIVNPLLAIDSSGNIMGELTDPSKVKIKYMGISLKTLMNRESGIQRNFPFPNRNSHSGVCQQLTAVRGILGPEFSLE